MTLRIGITANALTPEGFELVRQAEQLGVDSVWVPEFWAGDALTPLAFLAAGRDGDRIALDPQQVPEQLDVVWSVIDDQHSRGCAHDSPDRSMRRAREHRAHGV